MDFINGDRVVPASVLRSGDTGQAQQQGTSDLMRQFAEPGVATVAPTLDLLVAMRIWRIHFRIAAFKRRWDYHTGDGRRIWHAVSLHLDIDRIGWRVLAIDAKMIGFNEGPDVAPDTASVDQGDGVMCIAPEFSVERIRKGTGSDIVALICSNAASDWHDVSPFCSYRPAALRLGQHQRLGL